jgi:hypothetical protein
MNAELRARTWLDGAFDQVFTTNEPDNFSTFVSSPQEQMRTIVCGSMALLCVQHSASRKPSS